MLPKQFKRRSSRMSKIQAGLWKESQSTDGSSRAHSGQPAAINLLVSSYTHTHQNVERKKATPVGKYMHTVKTGQQALKPNDSYKRVCLNRAVQQTSYRGCTHSRLAIRPKRPSNKR